MSTKDGSKIALAGNEFASSSTRFESVGGRIGRVCSPATEPKWSLNVKRAVLSTLQVNSLALENKRLENIEEVFFPILVLDIDFIIKTSVYFQIMNYK